MTKLVVKGSLKGRARHRRGGVTALSTVLVLSALSPTMYVQPAKEGIISAARPGPTIEGAPCSKLGKRTTFNKVNFICKAGKNSALRWVKVELKPQVAPKQDVQNEATPLINIPVQEPSVQTATQAATSTTLTMLPTWAFSNGYAFSSEGKINSQPIGFIPELGPTTSKETFEPIVAGIEHAYELFTRSLQRLNFPSVPKIQVVLAEAKDADWFFATIAKHGHNSPGFEQNNRARMVSEGGSLMAAGLSTFASTPLLLVLRGPEFNYGEWEEVNVGAHEYTHAVQATLDRTGSLPCWAKEGGATYFGVKIAIQASKNPAKASVGFENSLAYSVRTGWRGDNYRPTSDDEIIDLLRRSEPESNATCTSAGRVGYSLGLLVSEAQADQWGEDAMIRWWARAGQIGWRPAWKEIYNVDADVWMRETAVPHIQSRLKALPRQR